MENAAVEEKPVVPLIKGDMVELQVPWVDCVVPRGSVGVVINAGVNHAEVDFDRGVALILHFSRLRLVKGRM